MNFRGEVKGKALAILAGFALGGLSLSIYRFALLPYLDGDKQKLMYAVYAVMGAAAAHLLHLVRAESVKFNFQASIAMLEGRLAQSNATVASSYEARSRSAPTSLPFAPNDSADGVAVYLPHVNKSLEAVVGVMWRNWASIDHGRLPKQVNIAREIDAAL